MIFSVEISNPESIQDGGHTVQIFIDAERLQYLIKILTRLAEGKVGDHAHLMTDSWMADGDLSENLVDPSNMQTNQLEIIRIERA